MAAMRHVDEDPLPEDIRRFGGDHDTGFCPDCGAEVHDDADICPRCFAFISGQVTSKPPTQRWFRGRWRAFVVILVLLAFGLGYLMYAMRRWGAG
jgi:hypothetical protein